jgi:hypothetical protein
VFTKGFIRKMCMRDIYASSWEGVLGAIIIYRVESRVVK